MTNKYINSSYPDGYALNPLYSGLIIGPHGSVGGSGVSASSFATVWNYGVISANTYGVSLTAGGTVVNGAIGRAAALINGSVTATYGAGTVDNFGTIQCTNATPVLLRSGGLVTNGSSKDRTALIETSALNQAGIWGYYCDITVQNFGTISAGSNGYGSAVDIYGGIVINGSQTDTTALMKDGYGVSCGTFLSEYHPVPPPSAVYNFGTIDGTFDAGVILGGGGTIVNGSAADAKALIEGNVGIYLEATATVTNFGTIAGYGGVAVQFSSSALAVGTLQLEPGSHLVGSIAGFTYGDAIDLPGVPATQVAITNGVITVTNNSGTIVQQVTLAGNFLEATFGFKDDGAGGETIVLGPNEQILAEISGAAYTKADYLFGTSIGKYQFVNFDSGYANNLLNQNNFFADYYVNADAKQIVVGFRGTDPYNVTNLIADASFFTGFPTSQLMADLTESVAFLLSIETNAAYKGYDITLTGHSLGGAVAQLLGMASGLPTVAFDAPGGYALYAAVQSVLAPIKPNAQMPPSTGANLNISMAGDQVSDVGVTIGTQITIPSLLPNFNPYIYQDVLTNLSNSHSYNDIIAELQENAIQTPGKPYPDIVPSLLKDLGYVTALSGFEGDLAFGAALFVVQAAQPVLICAAPPPANSPMSHQTVSLADEDLAAGIPPAPAGINEYAFVGQKGSPDMASLVLPVFAGVTSYEVSTCEQGVWSAATSQQPDATVTFGAGVTGFRFWAIGPGGQPVALPINDDFYLQVTFAEGGTFTGALSEVLGTAQWVGGSGDWSTGADWSDGASPDPGSVATISAPGSYSVTISTPTEETLININHAGATVVDSGSLILDDIMTIAAGRFELTTSGVVSGGTIAATGGTFVWAGGTLDDVTYRGTLSLAGKSANLFVSTQLLATDSNGTGTGDVLLTGARSELSFIGSQTFDNAIVAIGSASSGSPATLYNDDPQGSGAVLNLGQQLTIEQAGLYAVIGGSTTNSDDGAVNFGAIDADINGGRFVISTLNFTNNGTITVSGGDDLLLQMADFTNLSGKTLTGGVYIVNAESTLEMEKNAVITSDDATIELSGAGSRIESLTAGAEVAIDATLQTIAAAGTLELLAGRGWSSTLSLTNNGTIDLASGAFAAASLTNSGIVRGYGSITAGITNSGTVIATGGTLDLSQVMTGSGAMVVDADAVLEVDSGASATLSASFSGADGQLALKTASQFFATISGFAASDTIDLLATTATEAKLGKNDTLVITNGTKSVATLQLSGSYGGDTFETAVDGNGGTDITVVTGGGADSAGTHVFVSAMAGWWPTSAAIFERWGEIQNSGRESFLTGPIRTQAA